MTNDVSYMPHGICLSWRLDLLALHIVSDFVIGFSYVAIPVSLYVYRAHLPKAATTSRTLLWLFGSFILLCGATHFVDIVVLYYPRYWEQGILKAVTALISLMTAFVTVMLVGRLSVQRRNGLRKYQPGHPDTRNP